VLTFLVTGLVAVAAGALVGRWWILIVAACAWPVVFIGFLADWWGSGVGDGWPLALAMLIVISVAGAALGVLARHRLRFGDASWRARSRRVG
jgi:hypothetical protein